MRSEARADARSRVRIVERDGISAVVAAEPIAGGSVIYSIDGPVVATPSRYSVQIGAHEHVDVRQSGAGDRPDRRYVWCYLNHSCEPNAMLRGRTLLALRPIAAGEQVTFDYDTTEWDMASPFPCNCGSPRCRGMIRGYRHLDPRQRAALRPLAATHLLDGSCGG